MCVFPPFTSAYPYDFMFMWRSDLHVLLFVNKYLWQAFCAQHLSICMDHGMCTVHVCLYISCMHVCLHTWLSIHTRMCARVSTFVRNSTNVTVMSQVSRSGSLPHLINDTPPLMTALTGQQNPRTLPFSSPSYHMSMRSSIHPSVWTRLHSDFKHFFIWNTWVCVENASYLSVRLYAARAHFSCCRDSVVSSLNEGERGCVCEEINQPVLFVIKVMGDGSQCLRRKEDIFHFLIS